MLLTVRCNSMARHHCTKLTAGLFKLLHGNWNKATTPVAQRWPRMFHVKSASNADCTLDVSGIFPPIVTPFNDSEDIDYQKLKINLSKWNKIPFAGMIAFFIIFVIRLVFEHAHVKFSTTLAS